MLPVLPNMAIVLILFLIMGGKDSHFSALLCYAEAKIVTRVRYFMIKVSFYEEELINLDKK